ncbi:hypothetical protein COCC4DRAFT_19147 [Bipolaris maydis ATCC 48331]|uniref:Heterokaryon incompatibility domain-containing protein n=2 Tax=Cochliobolus heterostrophus TaxID=5016 RepID=M2TFV7_COCH5|nr:uncharacterized protein COCC4DRAFT_19147 [Bipolaris maydis ATCC 48331]EMD96320.1 hypothetical protein COCHEDRAFT_1027067 [Bipolaris maydis C5]KAJ5020876.1 hypothetical protein J3E73DRAFT_200694 [Bipolaris maydis]ENI11180.1 hypothetical protein COCC4DRAFT_19147 [Bipolaris maydis ATCC 48331]KAJ5030975.1 hypothetical protein J3E73DRAFT_180758 [Bipolaris maydis]KAJ6212931.1 hypothetical protein PSV09DRAFT_1027067 [Bipolaris maydis]
MVVGVLSSDSCYNPDTRKPLPICSRCYDYTIGAQVGWCHYDRSKGSGLCYLADTKVFFSFLEEVYAKTTQNARAVNKSFEIVFFCIDAFGRVQDPDDDKLMELSKTASIYRGTHCTIAFIFSKAAIRGFLDVQEGGNDAKTWNVNTDAPEVSKSFSRTSTRAAILELRNDFDKPDNGGSENSYQAKWRPIVHHYTKRSVTVPTDILFRLSGILDELETSDNLVH